jgi:hypothetical protein
MPQSFSDEIIFLLVVSPFGTQIAPLFTALNNSPRITLGENGGAT